jgi:hypothetical protein
MVLVQRGRNQMHLQRRYRRTAYFDRRANLAGKMQVFNNLRGLAKSWQKLAKVARTEDRFSTLSMFVKQTHYPAESRRWA